MNLRISNTFISGAPRRLFALGLIGALGLLAGCSANASTALHWPVPLPPGVDARQPRLWVALAARLGASPQSAPLQLQAATGSLMLRRPGAPPLKAPAFRLGWQRVALPQPLQLRRLVAGPFPSFETAETKAQQWRTLGVSVTIAKPLDWELWAPEGSPLPRGWRVRSFAQSQQQALVPALLLPGRPPEPLQGPITIEAPGGLRWDRGVYAGPFQLQADAHGSWSLVEQVPLERYLEGVVPHEIGAGAPAAALAAQTVLARTWALRNQHRFRADGYHLCAGVQCQVYSDPRSATPAVKAAIRQTRDQLLTWRGRPIHAVYHATNGGVAAPLEEAWETPPLPYLRAGLDRLPLTESLVPLTSPLKSWGAVLQSRAFVGDEHRLFRWTRTLDRPQIAQALAGQGMGVGEVQRLVVLERGFSGRVVGLAIEGTAGRVVLWRDAIRRTLRSLPSTLFELVPQGPATWLLQGGGFGHGVGLSQAGAIALGQRGWSYQRILERYYPGTQLQTLQQLAASQSGGDP